MTTLNLTQSEYDSCFYLRKSSCSPIYLSSFVDNILVVAKDVVEFYNFKIQLGKEFEMKDIGVGSKILGMMILNMKHAKVVNTPLIAHLNFQQVSPLRLS